MIVISRSIVNHVNNFFVNKNFFFQEDDPRYPIVKKTYTEMNKLQTVESATERVCIYACIHKHVSIANYD